MRISTAVFVYQYPLIMFFCAVTVVVRQTGNVEKGSHQIFAALVFRNELINYVVEWLRFQKRWFSVRHLRQRCNEH